MKDLFIAELNKELAKDTNPIKSTFTEEDIAGLPGPVQKYFHYSGYLGKEKMINAQVIWKDVYLKTSLKNKWMSIECFQFNSVPEPTRIAYMKNRMMGIVPFEGRDKYQDGHGNMLIKLAKVIPIADAKGREMDESALVTILAESLLIPSYALQPYIQWFAVDEKSAKAVITYNGIKVGGIFHFNDEGAFTDFVTEDRNYSERGTEYKKIKWSGVASNYVEKNRVKFPSEFKGVWHTEEGDYEYFKGTIVDIRYNVDHLVV